MGNLRRAFMTVGADIRWIAPPRVAYDGAAWLALRRHRAEVLASDEASINRNGSGLRRLLLA